LHIHPLKLETAYRGVYLPRVKFVLWDFN